MPSLLTHFPLMAVAGATWGGRCPCAWLSGGREPGVPPAKAHRPPPQRPLLPIPALPKTSGLKLQRTIVVNAALIPKMLPE